MGTLLRNLHETETKSNTKRASKVSFQFSVLFQVSLVLILFSFSLVLPSIGHAAELFFEPGIQEVSIGQEFQVDLMLDPQGKKINVVAATLSFSEDLLDIVEIGDGSSILTLWVEKPVLQEGKISFAGMAPGGFIGILGPYKGAQPGKILEIGLRGKSPGQGGINIEEAQVLLHDGKGTPAEFSISNFQFSIKEDMEFVPVEPEPDTIPPESFTPEIARHPDLFDGKYFLVFSTTDKQTGVDYFEVKEGKRDWERAESPYLLEDQDLRSYIYVKAVDRAGNERMEVIEPRYPIRWHENRRIGVIIIIMALVIAYVIVKFLQRKKLESRR
jgi:hypothetical protein